MLSQNPSAFSINEGRDSDMEENLEGASDFHQI